MNLFSVEPGGLGGTDQVIAQAKGVLAHQGGLAMTDAFAVLRRYARRNNRRVTDCAHAVVDSTLTLDVMSGSG
ncbi:ANTAR domain-containing protein [Pseudonocardia charpentierae]|uniref:ANTAR domain-containing protein n=1 Tax=Pseudonocardia charpentierae TaxID=3075545 RepID=A0ABU2NF70_9PSEU|nr:ANTAR domain-containing protein [Pseudonocardia sp. DSM 45834]MDT0352396.1 ANTAR domain-containing protein [Pseudonocardia sp. DSM 45834]